MAGFIKVQTTFPHGVYRLNLGQIVSYVADDSGVRRTNITLATGGAITAEISPEELDTLLEQAGIDLVPAE